MTTMVRVRLSQIAGSFVTVLTSREAVILFFSKKHAFILVLKMGRASWKKNHPVCSPRPKKEYKNASREKRTTFSNNCNSFDYMKRNHEGHGSGKKSNGWRFWWFLYIPKCMWNLVQGRGSWVYGRRYWNQHCTVYSEGNALLQTDNFMLHSVLLQPIFSLMYFKFN